MAIAWLFPGQGSQAVGMGKDLFESSKAAREVFERADAALGEKLSKLILEGPEADLILTANAQPAIVAMSIAVLAAIREKLDLAAPTFAAGHSLGEYSALVAAGALSLEDAVRTVRARGAAMQEAVPADVGAMAAIMGLDPDQVRAICEKAANGEVVAPANFNAPGQIVIAGHAGAVARARELAAAQKGKAIALKVSAPFHCALMAPAAKVVNEKLGQVSMRPLSFPVVANYSAKPNADSNQARELLVKQVDGPVRWQESVEFMREQGIVRALEIGPGKVLAGLVKRIAKDMEILSVSDSASIEKVSTFLK